MSDPQNKEFSPQWRMLLASVLAIVAIMVWSKFFGPKLPPPGQNPPGATAPETPGGATSLPPAAGPEKATGPRAGRASAPAAQASAPKAATDEGSIVVENDLYRVEFSNRGAVVKSWKLKKYQDDNKPPRTLDLVHPDAAQQLGGWPFSLVLDDATQEAAANSALYVASSAGETLRAPADLRYQWSDGHIEVTKEFHFDHSYVVHVDTTVLHDGRPVVAGVAWRGGFGDTTVINPAPFDRVMVFKSAAGKLDLAAHKNLGAPSTLPTGAWPGPYDYAGIEDTYFAAVFLPEPEGGTSRGVTLRSWLLQYKYLKDAQAVQEPVSEMAAGPSAPGPLDFRVYVGPKDYDDLKRMTPPLNALVQFGWFEFVSAPLFYLLKWEHKYVANYGWAIILMTFAINMVMYPLKVISWRTMQKMQKVAPEIRQINDRYKKYSFRDTEKQQQKQQEVMAVYHREGINPFGGASCLLSLVQLPIWFGLNRMLGATIELRHQPWILWIRDLSARDPLYVLPVLAAVSMYVTQKMTPVAATDPSQQQMMKYMPLMFSGMFIIYPWSSGLMLYIVTSTIVAIGQQWFLNKTHPAPAPAKIVRGKKK
ncbi:MAG TPA: membrane protein insertase YidC [Candidatus Acidoferrales bacterium]